MKIYTKTGDRGQSFLASGERRAKTDPSFTVLGNLDELSAWLGLLACSLTADVQLADRDIIWRAQAACLAAGAWAAEADEAILEKVTDTVTADDIIDLEARIDRLSRDLPELTSFILPGGTPLSAQIHVARAVARRLERSWLKLPLALGDGVAWPRWREYWNRLSDYLFVLARSVNQQADVKDVTWRGQS